MPFVNSKSNMFRPLWIEVDLRALRNNFKAIKKLVGDNVKVIATIKQSAYGHGIIPIAKELSLLGVDFFGVGSVEEGISLRESGIKEQIIILTVVLSKFAGYFIKYNLTPTIVDLKFARELNKEAEKKKGLIHPVHVKIDTGMGRLGLHYQDAYKFIRSLKKLRSISLEGVYTHFPAADTDLDFTNYQINIFNKFISKLKDEGITFKFQHCANSVGIANFSNSHFNMVRPGLMLYGIKPVGNIDLEMSPVLSLKSKIVFRKSVQKGVSISYGRTYITDYPALIATVAVGYADGYSWNLSNCAKVIIKDNFFDLVGRVCMDHIMVNLKDRQDIKVGDEVILIGRSRHVYITAEDVARWSKTIPYEIVSRLSLKIPRIYKYSLSLNKETSNQRIVTRKFTFDTKCQGRTASLWLSRYG